jgi:hypothetical protein
MSLSRAIPQNLVYLHRLRYNEVEEVKYGE